MAVVPQRARLLGQRHLRQPFCKFGIVEIAEINPVIGSLDQSFAIEAVGDAGRVQQQILYIDGPAQWHQVERRPAGIVFPLDADLHAGKGWYVLADGIIQRDFAAVDQHHRRHAGNGLGDRMDREDRIRRHRRSFLDVALAEAFEKYRLAVVLDQNDGAGNVAGSDLAIDKIIDGRKLFPRQHRVWRRPKRGGRDGGDRRGKQSDPKA